MSFAATSLPAENPEQVDGLAGLLDSIYTGAYRIINGYVDGYVSEHMPERFSETTQPTNPIDSAVGEIRHQGIVNNQTQVKPWMIYAGIAAVAGLVVYAVVK